MKHLINRILLLSLACLALVSCKKGDHYYYDFQQEEQLYSGSIYDYLINQPGIYDSLAIVLERIPALKSALQEEGDTITFFAVSNRSYEIALENLNNDRRNMDLKEVYLEDMDLDVLDSLSYRYLFEGNYGIEAFDTYLDGRNITSAKYDYEMHALYKVLPASGIVGGGGQELMFSDVNRSIYQRYWNSTTTSAVDFKTKNGIIHALSPRHEFGFGKLTTYLATE